MKGEGKRKREMSVRFGRDLEEKGGDERGRDLLTVVS